MILSPNIPSPAMLSSPSPVPDGWHYFRSQARCLRRRRYESMCHIFIYPMSLNLDIAFPELPSPPRPSPVERHSSKSSALCLHHRVCKRCAITSLSRCSHLRKFHLHRARSQTSDINPSPPLDPPSTAIGCCHHWHGKKVWEEWVVLWMLAEGHSDAKSARSLAAVRNFCLLI